MLMPLTLGLMALGCASVGVRGLFTNRPFLFSPGWFLLLIAAVFCANFGVAIRDAAVTVPAGGSVDLQPLVLPALFAVVALLLYVQFRGFIAVGVTGPLFQEALFVSIKKLGLPFEQRFSVVDLPSARTRLRMSVQTLIGTAQIKRQRWRGGRTLREIARAMNDYFESRKIATYQIACIYYLALALMLSILAWEVWAG
jgi:hypothetical protein